MPDHFPTPQQTSALSDKPILAMQAFAAGLNWKGLRLHRILFSEDESRRLNGVPKDGVIAYYMTTHFKFCLDIRELNDGTPFTHRATVRADRYGIKHTGWHCFKLDSDTRKNLAEVERLRASCDRLLFKDRRWVNDFKRNHPELLLPSRKRRRNSSTMRK